jgi:two-component system, OmpR family, sensor histidine kinase KdpD
MIETAFRQRRAASWRGYLAAIFMVAGSTLVALAIEPSRGTSAVDLLFLPAVLGAATLFGLGPALFAATASALSYNFFFTAPRMTFHVDDPNDLVTILVLFAVAVVVSQLAASVRAQAQLAEAHANRNATVAGFARQLLSCTSEAQIAQVAVEQLGAVFDCNAMLVAPGQPLRTVAGTPTLAPLAPNDAAVAALVLDSGERAGRGVDRAVPGEWQFHPVRSGEAVIAAAGLARNDGLPPVNREQLALLDNLLDQLALALERSRLEREAGEHSRGRERDQVRSALLLSIGQDLGPAVRTIGDNVAALRRDGGGDKALLSQLATDIVKVDRYLANLLDLNPESDQRPVTAGDVTIDLFHRTVTRGGEAVHLAPKEYAVLAELAKHPGRVLTHAHLLRTAWGPAQESQIDYLRVAVRGLRRKLEADPAAPAIIVNEPAVGYRLNAGS